MTALMKSHPMGELPIQFFHLQYIRQKFCQFIDMIPYMEVSLIMQRFRHVFLDVEDATAGGTDDGIIGMEQADKMAANFHGFLFHAGIGQGLPAAGLVDRGLDIHTQFFQQQQGGNPGLRIKLVNITWNKQANLHAPKVIFSEMKFGTAPFFCYLA